MSTQFLFLLTFSRGGHFLYREYVHSKLMSKACPAINVQNSFSKSDNQCPFLKPLESHPRMERNIHITQQPHTSVDPNTFRHQNEAYYIHFRVVIAYWYMHVKLSMQYNTYARSHVGTNLWIPRASDVAYGSTRIKSPVSQTNKAYVTFQHGHMGSESINTNSHGEARRKKWSVATSSINTEIIQRSQAKDSSALLVDDSIVTMPSAQKAAPHTLIKRW